MTFLCKPRRSSIARRSPLAAACRASTCLTLESVSKPNCWRWRNKATVCIRSESVSDALIGIEKYREYREQEANLTASAEDATRLARLRYNGGSTGYLEVLTNDTNYYSAQLTLAFAREQEAISMVQLYSALGGGWKP